MRGRQEVRGLMNSFPRLAATLGSIVLALGCAGVKPQATPSGSGGSGNASGLDGFGGSNAPPPPCNGICPDFPATAVVHGTVPSNPGGIFGTPGSGSAGGPCL